MIRPVLSTDGWMHLSNVTPCTVFLSYNCSYICKGGPSFVVQHLNNVQSLFSLCCNAKLPRNHVQHGLTDEIFISTNRYYLRHPKYSHFLFVLYLCINFTETHSCSNINTLTPNQLTDDFQIFNSHITIQFLISGLRLEFCLWNLLKWINIEPLGWDDGRPYICDHCSCSQGSSVSPTARKASWRLK